MYRHKKNDFGKYHCCQFRAAVTSGGLVVKHCSDFQQIWLPRHMTLDSWPSGPGIWVTWAHWHLSTVTRVFEHLSQSALELKHGVIPKKWHYVAVVALKVKKKDSNISQNAQLAAAAGSVHWNAQFFQLLGPTEVGSCWITANEALKAH